MQNVTAYYPASKLSSKLTIVIPTADRQAYMPGTLANITGEFGRFGGVRLIVVDNASIPPVDSEMCASFGVELKRYDDRGDVGNSINRAAKLAETEYVWVFGDDDLICPGVLPILENLLTTEQPDVVYLNRYISDHELSSIERTEHRVDVQDKKVLTGADAAITFTHHPGFISAVIFRKSMFAGAEECEVMFPGYGFMAAIYKNSINGKFVYLPKPWVVQRRSVSLWKARWPKFWLVTLPKMFDWLENTHGVSGALNAIKLETNRSAIRNLLAARANGYASSDMFWEESGKYLAPFAMMIGKIFRYVPVWLASSAYQMLFGIKKYLGR